MPGLAGFFNRALQQQRDSVSSPTDNTKAGQLARSDLGNMANLMSGGADQSDETWTDNVVYGTRLHLGLLQTPLQPVHLDGLVVWLHGEWYNRDELADRYSIGGTTDAEQLALIYTKTASFDFLAEVDGYYAAVVYDQRRSRIHLVTDRYGFRSLYFHASETLFAWSSESKGFAGLTAFDVELDTQAVQEFLSVGYLLENRSWLSQVQLVPPSGVLTYELSSGTAEIQRYWSWRKIKTQQVSYDEAVGRIGELLQESVNRRVGGGRLGVPLSGGLDSRAMLAGIAEQRADVPTFTFGSPGCLDIRLAKRVSGVHRAVHNVFHITGENWMLPRVNAVWRTDASVSLLHLHGVEFTDEMRRHADVLMHGFAGDLVLGGSYLNRESLDRDADQLVFRSVTGSEHKIVAWDPWYQCGKSDPFFINNRVRRFTSTGLRLLEDRVETRLPFFDNALIEFIYGLPDNLRYGSRIYVDALLRKYPKYYRWIPWQKTGVPISFPKVVASGVRLKRRVVNRLTRGNRTSGMTQYGNWMRERKTRALLQALLRDPSAYYPRFSDAARTAREMDQHMSGRQDHSIRICRVLTLELYCQQLLEGRHREALDFPQG